MSNESKENTKITPPHFHNFFISDDTGQNICSICHWFKDELIQIETNSLFSKKEYVAIHLKVPESGTPWLDEMIQKSRRDEFAKAAMLGLLAANAHATKNMNEDNVDEIVSREAYASADALIKVADKGKE